MLRKLLAFVSALTFCTGPAVGFASAAVTATPIRAAVTEMPANGQPVQNSKPGPGTPGWEEICRPESRAVQQVVPGDKRIAYYGRWDKKDAHAYRTDRGAAYMKFNFTGDYVAVHFQNAGPYIWWRSSIDGDAWQRFSGDLIAPLSRKGKHTLVLERDTETLGGISSITGITLAAEGKLLPPPQAERRRMEFVGDSVLAGAFALGTDGHGYLINESAAQSFGPQVARQLQAEYSIIATSGEGIMMNYQGAPANHKNVFAAQDYGRLLYNQPQSRFTAGGLKPQVVVLNHGANDFLGTNNPDPEQFKASYRQLILQVRRHNPRAQIICLEPVPFQFHAQAAPLMEQVVTELTALGDRKLHFVSLHTEKSFLPAGDFVDGEHPLLQGHAKLANHLSKVIAGIMGWN